MRVLIVDDDNLARRGLIEIVPWEEFGLVIAGEAANGEKALEFLDRNSVDIVITDIEMPFMSGIELMKIIKDKYPNLYVVVLTMHKEFDLIQESIWLKAIDYIEKVQIDKEQIRNIISRIVNRIEDDKNKYNDNASTLKIEGILFISELDNNVNQILPVIRNDFKIIYKLQCGVICEYDNSSIGKDIINKKYANQDLAFVYINNIKSIDLEKLQEALYTYKEKILFYDYKHNLPFKEISIADTKIDSDNSSTIRIDAIWSTFLDFIWLYNDTIYNEMLSDIRSALINKDILKYIICSVIKEYEEVNNIRLANLIILKNSKCYEDIIEFLNNIRCEFFSGKNELNLAEDVIMCIYKAIDIMKENIADALSSEEIAKKVNMSRSYFNNCFKNVVGQSFHDKLIAIRLDSAKKYLTKTNLPIKEVSLMVGYKDEKYFSRLFRNRTGILPSKYRKIEQ